MHSEFKSRPGYKAVEQLYVMIISFVKSYESALVYVQCVCDETTVKAINS